ncbi:MAG: fibrobacter succinogenes major paralogous domain-containing protein [Prevotellaceae bacterium]|jgi:uncharacterized protein (TIGR02145 family)|nr:fibrobacter succinogenes major paralogous domain-containing protein [Prevotellaceae bacterium]
MKKLTLLLLIPFVLFSCKKEENKRDVTLTTETTDPGVVINGVKWATRNVDKPGTFTEKKEAPGMLYQWNRKVGWSATDSMINTDGTTKWDNSLSDEDTKWIDANDPCPNGWRVPTNEELQSLLDAGSKWTTHPVYGRIFGSGNNAIFLPAVGYIAGRDGRLCTIQNGYYAAFGYYWGNASNKIGGADFLCFGSEDSYVQVYVWSVDTRDEGQSVRCVAEIEQ